MPLVSDLPLDITKSPQQILMDKFNATNGLNLSLDDFTFADPISIDETAVSNTKVALTPKLVSQFYNAIDLKYKRLDLTELLSNPSVTVRRTTETKLSDMIPKINAAFGINITADDYYDTDLSILYPDNPDAEIPVTITAKPTSLLFKGSYIFSLNRLTTTIVPTTGEDSIVYAVLSNPTHPIFISTIQAITTDAEILPQYKFMYNAITVGYCRIDRIFKLTNQDFVLIGQFQFDADLGAGQTHYDTTGIVLSPSGGIRTASNTIFQKTQLMDYSTLDNLPVVYTIVSNDSTDTADFKIFKYNTEGQEDASYSTTMNLGFKPDFIKVCSDGKVYAVSPMYTESLIKKIKIVRITASGTIDSSFTPVIISSTGNANPFNVHDLVVTYTAGAPNGFYLSLVPNNDLSSFSVNLPTVNGTALVPGGETQDYGYLPVVKIKQDGSLDANWNSKQKNYTSYSIHQLNNSTLTPGERAIVSYGDYSTWMTFIRNPITGFEQRIPIQFGKLGSLHRISGDAYYKSYRLANVIGFDVLDKGSLVAAGSCILPKANGGWDDPIDAIVMYKKDTTPLNVLYKAPLIDGRQTSIAQIICRKD